MTERDLGERPTPTSPLKGRGTASNPANRFETLSYLEDEIDPEDRAKPRTVFYGDNSKSLITYNDSPDIPFRASINPYRGCEHGCIYCYARPTHEFLGFSAGLEFETKILVKENAPELLKKELSAPKWKPQMLAMSGVTDPYQPVERRLELTRRCLEVLRDFRNPVGLITKNHLVTRDVDLLASLAEFDAGAAYLSVTTLQPELARVLEPRTSHPEKRLEAIRTLSEAGIPTGVMVAPVIPGLNDHEIPAIIARAVEAGARSAGTIMLRLPHAVSPLFEEWLENHYPDRAAKVLNRIRSMRSGRLNDPEFSSRMRGEGIFAEQIRSLFTVTTKKHGIHDARIELSTRHFRPPGGKQMTFFDT